MTEDTQTNRRARREPALRIEGAAAAPGDSGYHRARVAWNPMADQRPAPIARATDAADVAAAIAFAPEQGLGVAVQATGHHPGRWLPLTRRAQRPPHRPAPRPASDCRPHRRA